MVGPSLIQIKRSLTTAVPGALANGEFGYTANGDVLYIGSNSTIVAIAGNRVPGTLTANQALVTNSTNMIDTLKVGNSTVNAVITKTALTLANSTVSLGIVLPTVGQAAATNYYFGGDSTWHQLVGGSTSLSGDTDVTLTSVANNDLLVYNGVDAKWENFAVGNGHSFVTQGVLAVKAANGITVTTAGVNTLSPAAGGLLSNTTGIWAVASNGISVDTTGILVNVASTSGLISNTTGVWVKASTGITVGAGGVSIGQAVGTTSVVSFGNTTVQDLTVSGNISVTGTLTTIDATNIQTKDSLIKLADQQSSVVTAEVDLLDTGFYGTYGNTADPKFSGLVRDATDSIYKLWSGQIVEPTTTVPFGDANLAYSSLMAYFQGPNAGTGKFVANATNVTITANSTYTVALIANSLTLSTALAGTSGGTGLGTITAASILVANATNGYTALGIGSSGQLLQANSSGGLEYNTLDGGTF